jgi:SAM-dependent methyltransferase
VLCGHVLTQSGSVPGYQEPASYVIWDCRKCHTMVAQPRRVDPAVYDAIYAVPGGAPGYDRYFQLARGAKRSRKPLEYLSSRQDAVWGIERALLDSSARSVLEVGCGLGYLTYALRHAGYDAEGMDIAEEAIAVAKTTYGDYFFTESIESYAARSTQKYDAVIMAELIEHLEQPVELLHSALGLLSPSGSLILTTPNRTFLGYDEPWATDLPPVHLWWFSEDSLRVMAELLDCTLSLIDFSAYNEKYPIWQAYRNPQAPTLDASGGVIRSESAAKAVLRRAGILHETYWVISQFVGLMGSTPTPRRQAIVAVMTPR